MGLPRTQTLSIYSVLAEQVSRCATQSGTAVVLMLLWVTMISPGAASESRGP